MRHGERQQDRTSGSVLICSMKQDRWARCSQRCPTALKQAASCPGSRLACEARHGRAVGQHRGRDWPRGLSVAMPCGQHVLSQLTA